MTKLHISLLPLALAVPLVAAAYMQQTQSPSPDKRQILVKSGILSLLSQNEADLNSGDADGHPIKLVFHVNSSTKNDGAKEGDTVNVLYLADGSTHLALEIRVIKPGTGGPGSVGAVGSVADLRGPASSTAVPTGAARDAYNRTDSLSGVLANLDSYEPLSDVSVNFAVGKADLTKTDKETLDSLGAQAASAKSYIVQVTGGTDLTGGAQLNYDLSQRRAETVAQYLATKYNIPPHRFYLIGIGKDHEVASNKTKAGRSKNRRVEVQLLTNMDQNQSQ